MLPSSQLHACLVLALALAQTTFASYPTLNGYEGLNELGVQYVNPEHDVPEPIAPAAAFRAAAQAERDLVANLATGRTVTKKPTVYNGPPFLPPTASVVRRTVKYRAYNAVRSAAAAAPAYNAYRAARDNYRSAPSAARSYRRAPVVAAARKASAFGGVSYSSRTDIYHSIHRTTVHTRP